MRHGHILHVGHKSRWLLVLSLRSVGVLGSPHEVFQSQIPILRSHQDYGVYHGVGSTRRLQEQTCEQVHSASSWEQMRIGFELIDVQSVSTEKVNLVQNTLMARAVAYWSSTLQVRRAQGALKMDRVGSGCFKYAFDTDFRCQGLQTPTCGAVTIPAKYLKARRACSESCVPSYACSGNCVSGNTCACDVDLWSSSSGYCCSMSPGASCPTGCSLETAVKVGNGTTGGFVCEANCVQESEGVGAENEDLHIFVTSRIPLNARTPMRSWHLQYLAQLISVTDLSLGPSTFVCRSWLWMTLTCWSQQQFMNWLMSWFSAMRTSRTSAIRTVHQ